MRDEVVDGTALNSKWIPMALNGFLILVMVPCSCLTLPGKGRGGQLLGFLQNGTGS